MSFIYTAKAVANSILELCDQEKIVVTNMKLQKLLFFAQAWHVKLFDSFLFRDPIERWGYGPVVPAVYYDFNSFKKAPITSFATDAQGFTPFIKPESQDPDTWAFLKKIIDVYGIYDGLKLSDMTHAKGTAWSNGKVGTTISKEELKAGEL